VDVDVALTRFLSLWLVPWVGRSGRRLSTERSQEFMECVGGGLVVGLGGDGVVPSSFSGVRSIVVVRLLASCVGIDHQSWVFPLSAICFNLMSCIGRIVAGPPQTLFFLNTKSCDTRS
jgi:hypothetical protein